MKDDPKLRAGLIAKGTVRAAKFTGQDFVKEVFKMLDQFEPIRRNWK